MNISVQLCGLINLIVLLIFYLSAQRLRSYKRKLFLLILLISIVNISFDIGSIIAIFFKDVLPLTFVNAICKMYLCMLNFETWGAIMYLTGDVFPKNRHKMFASIFGVIAVVECFLVLKFPIHIFAENASVYTYGTSVNLLYVFAAVNICIIWISSFLFEQRIKKRRVYSVRLWMVIWLVGMGVQAIDHSLLVVGFAASLGIMVVYFMIENPEGYIDKQYDCLNSLALAEYVEESIYNDESFCVCELVLGDTADLEVDSEEAGKHIADIIDFFNYYKEIDVFKNLDKDIVLTSSDPDAMKAAIDSYMAFFTERRKDLAGTAMIYLERADRYKSIQDIMQIIDYVKGKYTANDSLLISIDEDKINEFRKRDHIKGEISRALSEDRVEVFLQPIYNTSKARFTSAEALVRIRNNDGSLLPPGLFIPVAEETGQINELGRRVLEKTCDFLAQSHIGDLGIEYIEVNLSVIQAEKPTLYDEIMDTVRKSSVQPAQINLEITESALIKNKEAIIDNMNQLKKVGFTFALDDFGKGESNLMYLVEMPFDILKLDMDMTKAFHVNDKAKSAVRTIRYMADEMKLKIVAEGIENSEELDAFTAYDIEYIQGYHFSKPLPMDEFVEFVRVSNSKE
ncbi:MAG: EAL domain-containing protein [Lachnospiraceae bacterium]|nr:EAL domain-containing protein [Lachnospiraceae bacterium]